MINKETGNIAEESEIEEWEEANRTILKPHRFDNRCDCYECKGEKFASWQEVVSGNKEPVMGNWGTEI